MPRLVLTRSFSLVVAVTSCASLALPTPARAQAVERALYVSVLDDKGAPVKADLAPTDLVVREDGMAREILRVTPATQPMQVAVLVDTSVALTSDVSNVREALEAFVNKVAGANGSEVGLVEYGDRPRVLSEPTTSPTVAKKGIESIFAKPGAGAYMLDAIVETSRGFQKREASRPVIVVVMIEAVEFSNASYDRVLEALAAGGAALHVMALTRPGGGIGNMTDEVRNRNIVIDSGTRQSGGRRENLLSSMALKPALDALAEELLHQWHVVYGRPQTLIPPEKVTVESARPELTVRGTPAKPVKGA
jgi:hypothetical protein